MLQILYYIQKSLKFIVVKAYLAYLLENNIKKNDPTLKKLIYLSSNNNNKKGDFNIIDGIYISKLDNIGKIELYPKEIKENIRSFSQSKNINFNKTYSQLFDQKAKFPDEIFNENKKEINLNVYIEYKRKILENRLDFSHIEFLSSLFSINKI